MLQRIWMPLCLLAAALPAAGGEKTVETDWLAVLMNGQKMGHGRHVRTVEDGKVTTVQEVTMTVQRMGTSLTIRQVEQSVETAAGEPLSFRHVQDMGIMAQTISGRIAGGKLHMKTSGGAESTRPWPEGALLPEGLRLHNRSKGLKPGTEYTVTAFSPAMRRAVEVAVSVGEKKQVDLLGRVVTLTEVKTVTTGPTGEIHGTSYVDDDFDALRTIVPMLGMKMEMVACTRQVALSPVKPVDFFRNVLLAAPSPLRGLKTARRAVYQLRPTGDGGRLDFLETPAQRVVRRADGSFRVTVSRVEPPTDAPVPYKGDDAEALAALKPTPHLQADAREVVALANRAVRGANGAADAAGRIEKFVAAHITAKDLSVGYATALEVAKNRQGDCTEHAALAAAMCRAAGLPAQVVTGLAHVERFGSRRNVFVPHAWFRAYVGGKWIDYDAALGGFDVGHIALSAGDGEAAEFFGVANTLGYVKMVSATVER